MLLLELFVSAQLLPRAWREADRRVILPIALAACAATPVGAVILFTAEPEVLRRTIGALVLTLGLRLLSPLRYHRPRPLALNVGLGLVSGVMKGSTGMSGPPVILCLLAGPDAARQHRANLILFFGVVSVVAIAVPRSTGLVGAAVLIKVTLLLPVMPLCVRIGARLFRVVPERLYRPLCAVEPCRRRPARAAGVNPRPCEPPLVGRALRGGPCGASLAGQGGRAPHEQPGSMAMIDPFGRRVSYLRVSVTDRCDLRCTYCMAEDMTFLPKSDVLTLEELDRLCGAFVGLGVEKLRLTGGEPLVRRGVMQLVRSLGARIAGDGTGGALRELTLTTNGTQLAKFADELFAAGVRRINVSMDTLDPVAFRAATRWGDLTKVQEGIFAAKRAGLRIKINAVALKGINEHEFDRMLAWCGEHGFDLCLIETMPMGEIGGERADRYLPLSVVRTRLRERWTLDESDHSTGGPARYYDVRETGARLGLITPLTHNFCESCNRVRLTCTGTLYMCLGQDDAADLRGALRDADIGEEGLRLAILEAISRKPRGHDFVIDRSRRGPAVARHMSVTGG